MGVEYPNVAINPPRVGPMMKPMPEAAASPSEVFGSLVFGSDVCKISQDGAYVSAGSPVDYASQKQYP